MYKNNEKKINKNPIRDIEEEKEEKEKGTTFMDSLVAQKRS